VTPLQEKVCDVAAQLNTRWHCHGGKGDDAIISCVDPRIEILEHVCHELAHAVTLGIQLGPELAARIGAFVRLTASNEPDGLDFGEDNELHCHAIVMRVMRRLGFSVSTDVFFAAAEMQIDGLRNIAFVWRRYMRTTQFEAATQSVLAILLERTP
jgi:hypothetical protein